MANFTSPEVRVTEIRKGPLVPTGRGQTIGGFLGITDKGPVNTPTLVTSFAEAQAVFGNYRTDSDLMYDVELFFKNGGRFAYICRVTGAGGIASAVSSENSVGAIIDWEASSIGVWADGTTVQTVRKAVRVTEIPSGANIGTGPFTHLDLVSTSRIRVGDACLVRSTNMAETDTFRFVVTGISGNRVSFASSSPTDAITVASPTDAIVEILVFDAIVRDAAGNIIARYDNLRMSSLSARYFETIVNNTFRTPVVAAINAAGSVATDLRPTDGTVTLAGGVDPTITDSSYIGGGSGSGTGLNAFEGFSDMDMLSVPGVYGTSNAVIKALLDFADLMGTFEAITDIPEGTSYSAAITFANSGVNKFTRYGEGYWYPRLKVLDPVTGAQKVVPSTGARQGIIARTHEARGTAKAAAGIEDGRVSGVIDVETRVTKAQYDLLYPARINAIRVIQGKGICCMGNITLDPTGEVIESGVAFYLLKLKKQLEANLQWVNFELNNATTRAKVVRNVTAILRQDWRNGLLVGKKEADAFFVICDETNNDAVIQAQRKLNVRIGVAVTHAAEFVDITLEQDTRAIDAALAASAG